MSNRLKLSHFIAVLVFFSLAGMSFEAVAATIAWKLFLKNAQTPFYSASTSEGEELVIPRIALPQGTAGAQGLVDALEGARLLIPRASTPLEVRITLNISGADFEPAHQKTVFLNIGAIVLSGGHTEDSYRFPTGSPMTVTIPAVGLSTLLDRCRFNRSDDLVLAFDTGNAFTKDGIVTRNNTSGLSAEIGHLSTIVGSRTDLLGLTPNQQMGPWHRIKLLFR